MLNRFLLSTLDSRWKNILVLLCMSVLWHISYGQQDPKVDSMLMAVQSMVDDTEKVHILLDLSTHFRKISNYTDSKKYAEDALLFAEKIKFRKGIAMSHRIIGQLYYTQANYNDALKEYTITYNICKEIGHKKGMSDTYMFIGETHFYQANNDEALHNYLAALPIQEEIGDKSGIAFAQNQIGAVYKAQGRYDEALRSFQACIETYEELKNKSGIATAYSHIGNIYALQGNYAEALKYVKAFLQINEGSGDKMDVAYMYHMVGYLNDMQGNYIEALSNYLSSLKILEEIGDKIRITATYGNIGGIYLSLGNYTEALHHYMSSLQINKEIGNKAGIASDYNNISVIYMQQGKFTEAMENNQASLTLKEEMGDKVGMGQSYNNFAVIYERQGKLNDALENYMTAFNITEEIGDKKGHALYSINIGKINTLLNSFTEAKKYLDAGLALSIELGIKHEIMQAYEGLTQLDSVMGNYKEALAHYKLYIFYKDSLANEESKKVLNEIQTKYETEKKDKEIHNLEKEKIISNLELKAHQEALTRIQLEKEKILVANLFNISQVDLLANEKRLQQLEIEKNEVEFAMQKAETESKQGQLVLLNKEGEIQKLEIKKQTLFKNYLLAGLVLFGILAFFVYNNYRTRQKLKLQTLRNKIASDLHDDVGSTLSSISIFSEMAQQQSKEVIPLLNTIGESSRKMLDAMADIVWTINPENDQFEKIILRMRSFAYDLLGAKKIDFEFIADEDVTKIRLPMEVRKNLYLIFKEATNNIVKYAEADRALFSIKEEKNNLTILIRDNGKGFDPYKPTEGNGIKNMKKRASEIGAKLLIDSFPGSGTTIQLQIAV